MTVDPTPYLGVSVCVLALLSRSPRANSSFEGRLPRDTVLENLAQEEKQNLWMTTVLELFNSLLSCFNTRDMAIMRCAHGVVKRILV
jgi:hypothetical protein